MPKRKVSGIKKNSHKKDLFTDATIERVKEAIAMGWSYALIGNAIGCSEQTLARWIKLGRNILEHEADPESIELSQEAQKADPERCKKARKLAQAVADGTAAFASRTHETILNSSEYRAAAYLLERRQPKDYRLDDGPRVQVLNQSLTINGKSVENASVAELVSAIKGQLESLHDVPRELLESTDERKEYIDIPEEKKNND